MEEWMIHLRFLYLGTSWRCGQLHVPAALLLGEKAPGTHWTGHSVGPRTDMDNVENRKFLTLPGLEL
jgi:hypothetical protein